MLGEHYKKRWTRAYLEAQVSHVTKMAVQQLRQRAQNIIEATAQQFHQNSTEAAVQQLLQSVTEAAAQQLQVAGQQLRFEILQ